MPGWAEVDERHERLYVLSWSAMRYGSRANGWVRSVDVRIPPEELGALVREALSHSRTDVPMVNFRIPSESPTTALLAEAGVKSYSGYARSMRACFIDFNDEMPGYLIRPTRNESRNALADLPETRFRLPESTTDPDLGTAIFRGIAASVGRPASMQRGATNDRR